MRIIEIPERTVSIAPPSPPDNEFSKMTCSAMAVVTNVIVAVGT